MYFPFLPLQFHIKVVILKNVLLIFILCFIIYPLGLFFLLVDLWRLLVSSFRFEHVLM